MILASHGRSPIIRTERGLTIAGTRITLYQLMDYISRGDSPKSFRSYFAQITDEQFELAISYIEANRAEVEAEYQSILKEAEEIRQYWEEQNHERLVKIEAQTPKLGYEAAWAKLQAQKARFESKA